MWKSNSAGLECELKNQPMSLSKQLWQASGTGVTVCVTAMFMHIGKHYVCVCERERQQQQLLWGVHSLFINTHRVCLLDESQAWQVPGLIWSWCLGDVERSQSALKSPGQKLTSQLPAMNNSLSQKHSGSVLRKKEKKKKNRSLPHSQLWLFDTASLPVAPSLCLSIRCLLPKSLTRSPLLHLERARESDAQAGN